VSEMRYCPARMYEYACELRYDHDGDHRQGHLIWERLTAAVPSTSEGEGA
jgi:hypothetical protein